jgi:hypothetical protein
MGTMYSDLETQHCGKQLTEFISTNKTDSHRYEIYEKKFECNACVNGLNLATSTLCNICNGDKYLIIQKSLTKCHTCKGTGKEVKCLNF